MLNYNPEKSVKYYVIVTIKMRTMRKCEISSPEQRPSSMLQMLCELFLFPFRYTSGTTCIGQKIHTCIMPGTFFFFFTGFCYSSLLWRFLEYKIMRAVMSIIMQRCILLIYLMVLTWL